MRSGGEISAIGSVTANVTPAGMGIAFTHIEPSDQTRLERWLAEESGRRKNPILGHGEQSAGGEGEV
jgi:hypothetical protein